jgi:hypothetical protein
MGGKGFVGDERSLNRPNPARGGGKSI